MWYERPIVLKDLQVHIIISCARAKRCVVRATDCLNKLYSNNMGVKSATNTLFLMTAGVGGRGEIPSFHKNCTMCLRNAVVRMKQLLL